MILFSEDGAPHCAPVRAFIYAKRLDMKIMPPPGGPSSDMYRVVSLTGALHCLILDGGSPLPDSP